MAYKYFLYSSQQLEFQKKIESNMGKAYQPGVVFTRGTKKSFTEMNETGKSTYSDAKVVAEGEESTMKYTIPRGR